MLRAQVQQAHSACTIARAEQIILQKLPIILIQISTYVFLLFYNISPIIPAYLTHFSLIKKSVAIITHAEKCVACVCKNSVEIIKKLSVCYESNSQ